MKEEFWNNYSKKFGKMLSLAGLIADNQNEVKETFENKTKKIFDKNLDDISMYRKDGKYITSYHASLYNKRREGEDCCPVLEISYNIYIQSEINKAYTAKLNADYSDGRHEMELNLMNFEHAYFDFVENYLKTAFIHRGIAFVIDDHNKEVIKTLISYVIRDDSCTISLSKGICLFGSIGSGKSTIMKALSKFTKDHDLKTQFDFIYMDDVYSDCDSSGLESLSNYRFKACAFDDIGMRADNNVNNYGTKINAYRELVRRQYNRFTRTIPSLSHYTTNIQYHNGDFTNALVKSFGARELDRFREMCNFVELGGPSKRK